MDSYYTINKNNKEDVDFLNLTYKFACDNYMTPKSNKYCVIGHSILEIQHALHKVTNYKLKYNNKKYRPWCSYKEESLNKYSDNNNLIYIDIPSYLNDENKTVNLKKYNKIITCVDNTWCVYQYENNEARKNALKDADVYFLSGNYILANDCRGNNYPILLYNWLEPFVKNKIKLSFAFFTDEKLADMVQKQVYHITSGFNYKEIIYFKDKISNGDKLLNMYEKGYNRNVKNLKNIKKIVKEYNSNNSNNGVDIIVEPSRYYVYITSNNENNIKNFTNYYNELDYEYEINKTSNNIFRPKVYNGIFIKLNK